MTTSTEESHLQVVPVLDDPEVENPFAGQGWVLLDIGGDVGALVVTMPRDMIGVEVDIDHAPGSGQTGAIAGSHEHDHAHEDDHRHDHGHDHGHAHGHRPHVAVVDRQVGPGAAIPSLVYPELVEGSYALYLKGTEELCMTAQVVGGEVTTVAWSAGS